MFALRSELMDDSLDIIPGTRHTISISTDRISLIQLMWRLIRNSSQIYRGIPYVHLRISSDSHVVIEEHIVNTSTQMTVSATKLARADAEQMTAYSPA